MKEELAAEEPSVIITRSPCVMLKDVPKAPPLKVRRGQVQWVQSVYADWLSRPSVSGMERWRLTGPSALDARCVCRCATGTH